MEKKKKYLSFWILTLLSLGMIIFSVIQIGRISIQYKKGEKAYTEIQNIAIIPKMETDTSEQERISIDFESLKAINSDIVGWIRFDEPSVINYPIVQGKDNSYYLNKTFQKYTNSMGSIFVDANNNSDFQDSNTIIYGHRMYNGTMFDGLGNYRKESFWKENPYFYIYTPDGNVNKYMIYSVAVVPEYSSIYATQFADTENFNHFLKQTIELGLYKTDVQVKETDKVVTLSTCMGWYDQKRLVVFGVLLNDEKDE